MYLNDSKVTFYIYTNWYEIRIYEIWSLQFHLNSFYFDFLIDLNVSKNSQLIKEVLKVVDEKIVPKK